MPFFYELINVTKDDVEKPEMLGIHAVPPHKA